MAWIDVIDEEDADGELADLYERIRSSRGKVANIMKVHSLHPEAMEKHLEFYLAIMFKRAGLSREQRELVATVVSSINGCDYCTQHHGEALRAYWKDDERLEQLVDDHRSIELSEADRALVDYAIKLTERPDEMGEADVGPLRDAGFSDESILNLALVTGYFNFVNRVAVGLGVELNEAEVRGYQY